MNLLSKFPYGKKPQPVADGRLSETSEESSRPDKMHGIYDNSPIPRLTLASFVMGVLVSMGGFIFGYDTGKLTCIPGHEEFQLTKGSRPDLRVPDHGGFPPPFRSIQFAN